MSVTEDDIGDALAYLACDPHPKAKALFKLRMAENETKRMYSELYLSSNQSTVDAKKASVEINDHYVAAKEREAVAEMEYENEVARTLNAKSILEMHKIDSYNARAAERIG